MPAVLLGLARLDAFGCDAELDPPEAELAESTDASAGEGRAVVAADHVRQAVFTEDRGEDRPGDLAALVGDDLAAEQVSAVGIGDGQGLALASVAGGEPAHVVDAPDSVGRVAGGERLGVGRDAAPSSSVGDQAVSAQDLGDGASRRPVCAGLFLAKPGEDLLGSEVRMATAEREDGLFEVAWYGVGMMMGRSRVIEQSIGALVFVALKPLVDGASADVVAPAQLGDGVVAGAEVDDHSHSLVHRVAYLPWHGRISFLTHAR